MPPAPNDREETWLLSYLDIVTLLLVLLLVLLSLYGGSFGQRPADAPPQPVAVAQGLRSAEQPTPETWPALPPLPDAPALPAWPEPVALAGSAATDTPAAPGTATASDLAANDLTAPAPSAADTSSPAPAATAPDAAVSPPTAIDATTTAARATGTPEAATAPAADTTHVPAPPLPATVVPPPDTAPPELPSLASLGLDQLGDDIEVVMQPESVLFRISSELLFAAGQSDLHPDALNTLDRLADAILPHPYRLRVEGHTDSIPIQNARFPSNWELSTQRATQVLRHLALRGIAPHRMSATGYADTRPLRGNGTAEGRSANRRVEVMMELDGR